MDTSLQASMRSRVEKLRALPSSPEVLKPLLDLLRLPAEQIDLKRVIELVSYDKTIAAQCLRIANSPLYGRARATESIQAAVVSVGIQRVEDILLTCCLHKFSAGSHWATDPLVFWRHSLGCASVCREIAERIDFSNPDKAYLAGLLHDVGILVNSIAYRNEYGAVLKSAMEAGIPLAQQEAESLGFTHCESGAVLAEQWQLPKDVVQVIRYHHSVAAAESDQALVSLVHLADQLCRLRGMGYGYEEWVGVELSADPSWHLLSQCCPKLANMDLARLTLDLDAFVPKVQTLVDSVFSSKAEQHAEPQLTR